MKQLLFILLAVFAFTCCGSGTKKATAETTDSTPAPTYAITYEGVGPFTFYFVGDAPEMPGYKITKDEKNNFTVTDNQGKVVITRVDDNIMTVLSPAFHTEEGLCMGMPLAEAAKLIGKWKASNHPYEGNDMFLLSYGDAENNIQLAISASQLKDASTKAMFRAQPEKLTLNDFNPDATIDAIIIGILI